jgi:hypothetical protein
MANPKPYYPVAAFLRGSTAFIHGQVKASLPAMQTDLDTMIRGVPQQWTVPRPFGSAIGIVPNAAKSVICVHKLQSSAPYRDASNGSRLLSFIFEIRCLIPAVGSNTSANFEMAKQVSEEHTMNWLLDDDISMNPKITIGTIGDDQGVLTSDGKFMAAETWVGAFDDIYPHKTADGISITHGWRVTYQLDFRVHQFPSYP